LSGGGERLEPVGLALPQGDHHADPAAARERRAHPLAAMERDTGGHRVGERVIDRDIEDDIRDQPGSRPPSLARASYSRRASLRSSHAMRLYSWPGLRRRNAGW